MDQKKFSRGLPNRAIAVNERPEIASRARGTQAGVAAAASRLVCKTPGDREARSQSPSHHLATGRPTTPGLL